MFKIKNLLLFKNNTRSGFLAFRYNGKTILIPRRKELDHSAGTPIPLRFQVG
jgi:hypothetical protein